MSKYESKNATAPARRRRKIRNATLGALAAMLMIGAPALAVMLVQSNEATAKVEAGTAVELKLTDAKPSGKLFPGMGVDATFEVTNPNPFPVTLTAVIAGSSKAPAVSCVVKGDEQYLSTALAIKGTSVELAKPVTIAPDATAKVELANVVKLGAKASGGCSVETGFKVTGSGAGSGN